MEFVELRKTGPFEPYKFTDFEYFANSGKAKSLDPEYISRPHAQYTFYKGSYIELNLLRNGLLLMDAPPRRVYKRESPDFYVELKSGVQVYVETIQATEQHVGALIATTQDMKARLTAWSTSNPSVAAKLNGRPLNFTFDQHIPSRLAIFVVDEIQRFVLSEQFDEIGENDEGVLVTDSYAALHELGSRVSRPWFIEGGVVAISSRQPLNPIEGQRSICKLVKLKISKARKWSVSPLWLVVGVPKLSFSHRLGDVISNFLTSIEPFERMILCEGSCGLMVSEAIHRPFE